MLRLAGANPDGCLTSSCQAWTPKGRPLGPTALGGALQRRPSDGPRSQCSPVGATGTYARSRVVVKRYPGGDCVKRPPNRRICDCEGLQLPSADRSDDADDEIRSLFDPEVVSCRAEPSRRSEHLRREIEAGSIATDDEEMCVVLVRCFAKKQAVMLGSPRAPTVMRTSTGSPMSPSRALNVSSKVIGSVSPMTRTVGAEADATLLWDGADVWETQ
jgi:hypothetical protein